MIKKNYLAVIGALTLGGLLFFLLSGEKATVKKITPVIEESKELPVAKTGTGTRPSNLGSQAPKNTEASGQVLESPVGYLEAATECLDQDFPQGASFLSILKKVGLIHKGNQTLRLNRIYEEKGQEIRISMARANDSEIWEAKVFSLDSQGYPLLLEKKSHRRLQALTQHYDKSFDDARTLQRENFLAVNNNTNAAGTVMLVNSVPVEVKIRVRSNDVYKKLECGAGRCSCYSEAGI